MLTKCPECKLQVSDKAAACPHCGYPMAQPDKPKVTKRSNRKRRLPNGFGQISEIKGRGLRKPFRAMVTVGKTEAGQPICKLLKPVSYFETYNDAYAALVEYNRNPYDLAKGLTVRELYDRWLAEYEQSSVSASQIGTIKAAWRYCSSLYEMPIKDVRARHIKGCINQGFKIVNGVEKYPTDATKVDIKSLFNLLMDYAVEYEIVAHNYARDFHVSDEVRHNAQTAQHEHMPFTDDEIHALWENIGKIRGIDMLLVQCYSGWRPRELCALKTKDVDIENGFFSGGMKTKAGKDRQVPIHSKVQNIVRSAYETAVKNSCEYLFNYQSKTGRWVPYTYPTYKNWFYTIREKLQLDPQHRPHDGRTHFVTVAKKSKLDEYAIKYIVGHQIEDLTERVYTKREFEWLRTEMEKIV